MKVRKRAKEIERARERSTRDCMKWTNVVYVNCVKRLNSTRTKWKLSEIARRHISSSQRLWNILVLYLTFFFSFFIFLFSFRSFFSSCIQSLVLNVVVYISSAVRQRWSNISGWTLAVVWWILNVKKKKTEEKRTFLISSGLFRVFEFSANCCLGVVDLFGCSTRNSFNLIWYTLFIR